MIIKYSESLYKKSGFTPSCAGSEEIPAYVLGFKPDGGVFLKPNGKKPIYKIIQANKVNCELSSVLETVVHENQLAVTAMSDVESAIADFTSFTNYADIFTGVKHLGQLWNEMPIEAREQFNSSKSKFISSIADSDFNDKLSKGYHDYYTALSKRTDVSRVAPVPAPSAAPSPAPSPAPSAAPSHIPNGGTV